MSQIGHLILVVGPSGVGKDTLIDAARERFRDEPRLRVVRRVITRQSGAGGEEHTHVSPMMFDAMVRDGHFAVHWQAHGLAYGIPSQATELVASNHVVICNGSRAALKDFRRVFPSITIASITAKEEVLAARLAMRQRETEADIRERLARAGRHEVEGDDVVHIDNSGAPDIAISAFIDLVSSRLQPVKAD